MSKKINLNSNKLFDDVYVEKAVAPKLVPLDKKNMLKKNIVKFSDLKIYKWVSSFDAGACDTLLKKLSGLGIDSSTCFKNDISFWVNHCTLILNLMLIQSFIMAKKFKDLIILEDNEFYLFQEEADGEALLLYCLQNLYHYWIGLLPIIAEIKKYYPEHKGEFGALEYSFLDIWVGTLSAMDEIIILLTKKNSTFLFKRMSDFEYKIGHFTINFLNPVLPTDAMFKETSLMVSSKTKLVNKAILDSLFYKDEFKDLLYSWLQTKLEYKFRIKDFTEKEAIKLFVTETFMDLDVETIRFLCANPVLDLDYLRQMAVEHNSKKGVSPIVALLTPLIKQE